MMWTVNKKLKLYWVFEEGKIRVHVVKKLGILVENNIDSRKKRSKDNDSKRKDSRLLDCGIRSSFCS